jgi:hypothetical protein
MPPAAFQDVTNPWQRTAPHPHQEGLSGMYLKHAFVKWTDFCPVATQSALILTQSPILRRGGPGDITLDLRATAMGKK